MIDNSLKTVGKTQTIMNRKMIFGILVLSIGALLFEIVRSNARSHKRPDYFVFVLLTCLIMMIIGVYFIFKGKRQQLEDRKNGN
jgi:lipopolysaccharide export LptBFGC system permease protein LptF